MRATDDLSPEQVREVENLTMILQAEGPDEFPTAYYEYLARERVTEAHTIKLARKVTEAHAKVREATELVNEAQHSLNRAEAEAQEARSTLVEWLS